MRRWLTFLSVLALAVVLGGVVSRIPQALSEVEAFRITDVRLRGQRFLTLEEVLNVLDLPEQASVWDDIREYEDRLMSHPLVKEVTVHRRFPDALLVRVVEVDPVALVPNPILEPVDASGRILPIDPAKHGLDLPIMTVIGESGSGALNPAQLRLLAGEIQRLSQGDPELCSQISDFTLDPRGDIRARVTDSSVTLLFRPGLPSRRIQTGLRVLADAREKFQEDEAVDLDLRFEDQFVVRFHGARGN
jgi:hypothetical protein